jgi:hypothetical protein
MVPGKLGWGSAVLAKMAIRAWSLAHLQYYIMYKLIVCIVHIMNKNNDLFIRLLSINQLIKSYLLAIARPIPLEAPVITMTWSFKVLLVGMIRYNTKWLCWSVQRLSVFLGGVILQPCTLSHWKIAVSSEPGFHVTSILSTVLSLENDAWRTTTTITYGSTSNQCIFHL